MVVSLSICLSLSRSLSLFLHHVLKIKDTEAGLENHPYQCAGLKLALWESPLHGVVSELRKLMCPICYHSALRNSNSKIHQKRQNGRTTGHGPYLVLYRRKENVKKEGLFSWTFRVLFNGLWEQDGLGRAGPPDDRHTIPSIQQNSGPHHWCRKWLRRRLTILYCASGKSRGLGDKCRHVLTSPCIG